MTVAPGLSVAGLHKVFGDQPVLRGLDLTVRAGSFTSVLGTSGSGKTTLLRILAGFERPDHGSVSIDGVLVDDGSRHVLPERRRLGYVSQDGSLFPHLTVEANVGFGLPRRERGGRRVAAMLETVDLAGLGQRYPHELSGGQQQRVALARALVLGARVVLLDEPFASLDAGLRSSVRAEVQAILRGTGTSAILVTHDQDEALSVSDEVAIIRDGMIAQAGRPREVYDHPIDIDLARFLGEANLVDGIADGDVVETGLGTLVLHGAPRHETVTVLVRPEQLEIGLVPDGAEASGRVIASRFHGHDEVVQIVTGVDSLPSPITARVRGGLELSPGAGVSVAVRGAVTAWSRSAPAGLGSPDRLLALHR
jgi:iron(III) transport system ATP-binding protein